jgi:hypothetical protein
MSGKSCALAATAIVTYLAAAGPALGQSLPQRLPPVDAVPLAPIDTSWDDGLLSRDAQGRPADALEFIPSADADPAGYLARPPYAEAVTLDEEPLLAAPPASKLPPGAKPGAFQRVALVQTWLGGGGRSELGMHDFHVNATWGLPCPTRESPLLVTPGFRIHVLDGPDAPDLPGQLYETYVEFRWLSQVTAAWGIDVAVSSGLYTDFERTNDESLRITGRGVAAYTFSERAKVVMGVAYLDREDVSLLPVAGLIWTPHESVRLDLIAPRPRLAYRLVERGGFSGVDERWVYVGAEFGGGSYTIVRADQSDDVATLSDYRILVGTEGRRFGGISTRLEAGIVFGRSVEYASGTPQFEPDETFLLRAELSY